MCPQGDTRPRLGRVSSCRDQKEGYATGATARETKRLHGLVLCGADVMVEEEGPERQAGHGHGIIFRGGRGDRRISCLSSVPMSTSIRLEAVPSGEATHTREASTIHLLRVVFASPWSSEMLVRS